MMPLEPGAKQKRFLLSANVPSCPFCMPGGPESLIEVLCKKPIAFNMEPIVISGKLSVLKDDPTGLWYRVTDAAPGFGREDVKRVLLQPLRKTAT